jgi:DNA phosphorothioation-dependent restriction protein DptG
MSRAATHFDSPASAPTSVEEDFHGWLLHQAALLRSRDADALDWEHLAEEIEAMASAERRELLRRLTTLFSHLLKMQYQAEPGRARSRRLTIDRSRLEIERLLEQSPGLRGQFEAFANKVYADGRREAATDIGLKRSEWKVIPTSSEWTLQQIMDPDFFPLSDPD